MSRHHTAHVNYTQAPHTGARQPGLDCEEAGDSSGQGGAPVARPAAARPAGATSTISATSASASCDLSSAWAQSTACLASSRAGRGAVDDSAAKKKEEKGEEAETAATADERDLLLPDDLPDMVPMMTSAAKDHVLLNIPQKSC